jgi:hypothetical protein
MKFLLSIAALAATCTALAQGASEAILDYSGSVSSFVGTTVGWTFQATTILTATELGCFAALFDDNPFALAIQVGLWDDSGTLLASNSITPASSLFDQTRYESIIAVPLYSGQIYHLGAYCPYGRIGLGVAGVVAGGVVSTSAQVQLRGAARANAGFAFPGEVAGGTGSIYVGPNFQFESQPRLTIQLWTGNQVRLSWSTAYPGYTPQTKPGLFGTWANAGLTVTVVGNEFVAFDSRGAGPKYYRLIK